MDDLIRRSEAYKLFCRYCSVCPEDKQNPEECEILPQLVHDLPTVDAVEVVRCRECVNWIKQTENPDPGGLGACKFHKANLVTGEGFCYWGQHREDGGGCGLRG